MRGSQTEREREGERTDKTIHDPFLDIRFINIAS